MFVLTGNQVEGVALLYSSIIIMPDVIQDD